MKAVNIFVTVLIFLALTACGEDFLDVKPSNSGDASSSIQTPEDARVIMNGLLSNMRSSAYYGRNFIMYANAKGGDLTIFSQGRGLDGLYSFNHSVTTGSYSGFWDHIYHCILQANSILSSIQKLEAEGVVADFDDIKGQALTARAMMYFDLVRLYGEPFTEDKSAWGVPNIIEPLDASAQPLRATVEENYQQILSDLQTAAPLISKSITNGYLNYYANMALQAKVNLYMGNHAQALTAAEEIINSGEYELYSNEGWVDSWTRQYGSESIFELAILPTEGDLGTSSLGFYLRRKAHGSSSAAGWFMASDYFLERLGEDPSDVRWGVMSYDEVSEDHLGASYKYSGSVDLVGDGKSTGTAVNIKVIRLSEIYLIAAEAALESDKALAAEYLNAIRQRSPNLEPATESTVSIDMILDE